MSTAILFSATNEVGAFNEAASHDRSSGERVMMSKISQAQLYEQVNDTAGTQCFVIRLLLLELTFDSFNLREY